MSWAALLGYYIFAGDYEYLNAIKDKRTKVIRARPRGLMASNFKKLVVEKYLNKWGSCRISNKDSIASELRDELAESIEAFNLVGRKDILRIDLGDENLRKSITDAFESLEGIEGVGPVIVSKVFHLMRPSVFVAWDGPIIKELLRKNPTLRGEENSHIYLEFLKAQQREAQEASKSFRRRFKSKKYRDPGHYLSIQLGYSPHKTLAKYIDEHNWILITHMEDPDAIPPWWIPRSK